MSASAFEWPIFKERTYSRYLKNYMYSFKNIYSENINASNLMFITGPTKCGKSVLLRQTLNDFAEKGQHNPVVFHFDFDDSVNSMMTFDVFLQKFENMIVNTIVENQSTLFKKGTAIDKI